jgi:2-keto-3-deoxy-L-rhamnonate aldolase RhmA
MYYKLGYRFLACGSDGSFISKAATDMAKKLKDLSASMKK